MTFTFTGQGWIGPILCILGGISGGILGYTQVQSTLAVAMFSAAVSVLLTSLVVSALGRELNLDRAAGRAADGGRIYHDRHAADGLPLQHFFIMGMVYATVCVLIGLWSIVGVLGLLLGAGVLLVVLVVVWHVRRRPADPEARTANRARLARTHGWKSGRPAPGVVDHWSRRAHEAGHVPLGKGVTGDLDGLPITVFDTRPPRESSYVLQQRKVMRTVCVVGLPHDYPQVHVREVWRNDDGTVNPKTFSRPPYSNLRSWVGKIDARIRQPLVEDLVVIADPDAHWVATPEVLRVTSEHRLAGWRLDGRDLALVLEGNYVRTNAKVMETLRGLTELARAFPPGDRPAAATESANPAAPHRDPN